MDPIFGQLIDVPWSWTMKGWMPCKGQLIEINQNQALFALLGVNYGGDGHTTFALPDCRPYENSTGELGLRRRREWHHDEIATHICTHGYFPSRD
jgi:microcystin-dependent protein